MLPLVLLLLVFGAIILLASIRQVNQWERGVLFTLGRFSRTLEPGWRIVIPVFQTIFRPDMRVKTVDVPTQESLTKDNISVGINAVLYFRVVDPAKVCINVADHYYATMQLAQTTMRNAVGEVTLDELLSKRTEISEGIKAKVVDITDDWGVEVVAVELKDILLPDNMKRTIGKEAEAERERRAVIIQSEGEVLAAENLSKAAGILHKSPGALHIRTLQAMNDISSDDSNTTVWMVPLEVLRALEGLSKK